MVSSAAVFGEGWTVMQRKVTGASTSFNQNRAAYRDGFGSATGNDNYWLGFDQIYRLMQKDSVGLRVEVWQFRENVLLCITL